jgi:hypothetical protein
MARKRYSDEDILRLLREVELHLASGEMPARIEISRHDDRVHILRTPATN